jgi:hypothetical protein
MEQRDPRPDEKPEDAPEPPDGEGQPQPPEPQA